QSEGDLLRISPSWTRWAYWLLVLVLVAGLLYAVLGTIDEYASGPAVVRVEGRTDITATTAGVVEAVLAQPGQRVTAEQALVRLYGRHEVAELERIEPEFQLRQNQLLSNPADTATRQALTTLTAQREQARMRKEERIVKAKQAGWVSDVRIRPGQLLGLGEVVLSLLGDDAHFSIIAIVPGHHRPMLRPAPTALPFDLGR